MSDTPTSPAKEAEAQALETTTKKNVFYTNDESSSIDQSTAAETDTVGYTSKTPFRGFFIYGAIVEAASLTSKRGSIRVLKREQDTDKWNLMEQSCSASCGDIQGVCFTKDELAGLARTCRFEITFDEADFNRTTKAAGTYNFSSIVNAGLVMVAWRFRGDPHHTWFDGQGFLIQELTAFPAESLDVDN